jgi:hypothetical protein
MNREGPGTFHAEGLVLPGYDTPGVNMNIGASIQAVVGNDATAVANLLTALKGTNPFTETVDFDPFNVYNQPNGKTLTTKYADLGGALLCNYCMKDSTDSDNAAEQKFGAWSLWDPNGSAYQYTQGKSGGKYVTFQLSSALFGGSADKYLPMFAINSTRIVMSCENRLGAFVINGLDYYDASLAGDYKYAENSIYSVHIVDPTFFMNMVRVDPTIDKQLIASAQSEDGAIRIHSQSSSNFQIAILAGHASWEYIVPIKASSLKAVYFTFSPHAWIGRENFTRTNTYSSLAGRISRLVTGTETTYADHRVMKTSWFWNNLQTY